MASAQGAVMTSVTLLVQDIGNTVTVLVHGWSSLVLASADRDRPVGN
jgi:hypothetical protein